MACIGSHYLSNKLGKYNLTCIVVIHSANLMSESISFFDNPIKFVPTFLAIFISSKEGLISSNSSH